MGYILILISLVLRSYGAVQEERNPASTPMIWQNNTSLTVLMFLWVVLLITGLYLILINNGVVILFVVSLIYFVLFPTLFGSAFKKLLEKLGF